MMRRRPHIIAPARRYGRFSDRHEGFKGVAVVWKLELERLAVSLAEAKP